jgi:hypothetical protein
MEIKQISIKGSQMGMIGLNVPSRSQIKEWFLGTARE